MTGDLRYVNGVGKRHGDVSRHMFANYTIHSITKGVHAKTWTSDDNTHRNLLAWSWSRATTTKLVIINYAPHASNAFVPIATQGRVVTVLRDEMPPPAPGHTDTIDARENGLVVHLEPWHFRLLDMTVDNDPPSHSRGGGAAKKG